MNPYYYLGTRLAKRYLTKPYREAGLYAWITQARWEPMAVLADLNKIVQSATEAEDARGVFNARLMAAMVCEQTGIKRK